jgi:hypothetical protein
MDSISICPNTMYMSTMDTGSSSIQEDDGDVIPGGIGSLDALARERLDSQYGKDGETETRTKGGGSAAGGGETARGNCHSWGPSRFCQPLRMGWPLGWKTVTDVLSKRIMQPWLAKGPRPMRVWGKDGMTWLDIVAGGRAEMEARVALATEPGHLFATVKLTVGAREL